MDASGSGGGGTGTADAGEPVWDWGNLLAFDFQDDDESFVLPWGDAAATATAADAFDPTELQLPDPATPQAPALSIPHLPPPSPAEGRGPRVRKRDPRLVCPNYLAGRVPCACPEVDEMAAAAEADDVATEMLAGARKRARDGRGGGGGGEGGGGGGSGRGAATEMRCQVPGCEADIRELKGYHRRHRVCLRCAHAAAVMLDGVSKRYCQQCGKFHILPDFDEDKRSCRRKLERHNKRRRRKPDPKCTLDKELEEQVDLSADGSGDGELREENNMNVAAYEMLETVVSSKVLDRETPVGSEDAHGSPTCTLPSLQNDQSKSVVSLATSAEVCTGTKLENAKITNAPVYHDTKSAYSSTCPTGRISFKLYDWNPAEFPRRLRHQIFEWLANMPVELEGYIRPGCTILTVFIAMPQHMWDKLSKDTANLIRGLVNSPRSLLLGRGAFHIYVNNLVFQVLKDGATLVSTRLEVQAPRIHYVHPICFEAGKPIEFILCGSYLDQPKFRSLLSFDGEYLKHDCCHLTSRETIASVKNGDHMHDIQHEIFRINVTQTNLDIYGPAFVEVENMSGLSNFVPVLFGSKQLCSELERIQVLLCSSSNKNSSIFEEFPGASSDPCERREFQQNAMSEFLMDIGWLVRKPSPDEFKNVLSLTNIRRWMCILRFLIQNDFVNVLEIILQSLDNAMSSEILSNLEKGKLEDDVKMFLGFVSHARNVVHHKAKHDVNTKLQISSCGDSGSSTSLGTSATPTNENNDGNGEYDLCSTSAAYEEEQSMPLVNTKDVPHRQCCHSEFGRWLNHSPVATFPSSAMRMRVATTLAVIAALCFTACVVLSHPHKVGVLAAPINRYLYRCSTS